MTAETGTYRWMAPKIEWLTAGECIAGMHEVVVTDRTLEAIKLASEQGRSLWRVSSTEAHFARFITIVLLSTNAMFTSLAMPLEALAETSETDNSIFNMPLLLLVALVGVTVGGLLARQRRGELQKLNEQLRQINAALGRQAVKESYAPALSYAPVGGRVAETEVIVDPKKEELISRLKTGKKCLRRKTHSQN